ncbi:hypothetical protein [uncultured Ruegeria sp.]|uniref:hypothetical protein n=1 Tax=uncultured Ruegeria sp. TaxID=259304 RepID=UPI00262E8BFE|nr:hypothetical protein [uncultured Ruegeria sp.]
MSNIADCVMNAPERHEYIQVLEILKPVLFGLPAVIVSIDGRSGAGKTTLGRFLAWRFNCSLLESDLFLDRGNPGLVYREEDVQAVIRHRVERDHPIIVEGVCTLRLLRSLGYDPTFHIRVECDVAEGTSALERAWCDYSAEYLPDPAKTLFVDIPALDDDGNIIPSNRRRT